MSWSGDWFAACAIWTYFATAGIPDEERVGKILDALAGSPRTLIELE